MAGSSQRLPLHMEDPGLVRGDHTKAVEPWKPPEDADATPGSMCALTQQFSHIPTDWRWILFFKKV